MAPGKIQRIKNSQVVGMRDQEGSPVEKIPVRQDRPARAEQLFFVDDLDMPAPAASPHILEDERSEIVGVDEDVTDAVADQGVKPVIQQWPAVDRDQALGQVIGEGLEPGAQASGKQQCAHG